VYLVDTNIISAAAPSKTAAPVEMVAWMEAQSALLFLSVVTVAEIEDGIAKAKREGAVRKSRDLTAWFETVLHLYHDRIVLFDVEIARITGVLSDRARGQGFAPGFADVVIAATAAHHRLTILTRNMQHFAPLNVPVLNPFAALPPV